MRFVFNCITKVSRVFFNKITSTGSILAHYGMPISLILYEYRRIPNNKERANTEMQRMTRQKELTNNICTFFVVTHPFAPVMRM